MGAVALLALLGVATPSGAGDRLDLFDKNSNRLGYGVIDRQTGRVDLYDKNSNRLGYGIISPSGRVDIYDGRSRRQGSGSARFQRPVFPALDGRGVTP